MPRTYDISDIAPAFNVKGTGDKIKGGALASQSSRNAALYSQMQAVPRGRRILCRAGIQGQDETLVISGTNPDFLIQLYPLATSQRVIARAQVRLTPGYVVAATAVCLPSGPVQKNAGDSYKEGPPTAEIKIDLILRKGVDTLVATKSLTPEWSTELYKGLPTAAGSCWGVLQQVGPVQLVPPEQTFVPGWAEGVEAEITISALGGVRPLDVCVYEVPGDSAAFDETNREGTISGFPATLQSALEHPITALFEPTNPLRGSHAASKAISDQRGVWGPVLAHWSSWNEKLASITATEGTAHQVIQTFFRDLHSTSIIGFASSNPGWTMASGAYARNLEQSGPLELRNVNGAIPCIVRVYARMLNSSHVGTVRFQTADYSYRDITVTGSTSFAWYSGLAWLRVPVHASLDGTLQILGKVNANGQTLEIRYASVEYGGHYVVTE